MSGITDFIQSASYGIQGIFNDPVTLICFLFFLLWASIYDLKTMKIRNYQNLSFFFVGLFLFGLSTLGIWENGFTLGGEHFYGAIVGFLLLFIPGMILNHAYGGDIKFVTVMGFWVGPAAIMFLLILATFIQLVILVIRVMFVPSFTLKTNFPYAPAFTLGYFLSLVLII